jgi:hypothetical protein
MELGVMVGIETTSDQHPRQGSNLRPTATQTVTHSVYRQLR